MITAPLPPVDSFQDPSPDTPLPIHDTNPSSKFQRRSSPRDEDESELESEPQLSRPSSMTPSTSDTLLHTPADDYVFEDRQWILSADCKGEVEEWGQYLCEPAAVDRRLSAPAAASSSVWDSMVSRTLGEFVP